MNDCFRNHCVNAALKHTLTTWSTRLCMICENSAKLKVPMMTASVSLMSFCSSVDTLSCVTLDLELDVLPSVVVQLLSSGDSINPLPLVPLYRCFRIVTSCVQQSRRKPGGTNSRVISSHLAMARMNVMQLVSESASCINTTIRT